MAPRTLIIQQPSLSFTIPKAEEPSLFDRSGTARQALSNPGLPGTVLFAVLACPPLAPAACSSCRRAAPDALAQGAAAHMAHLLCNPWLVSCAILPVAAARASWQQRTIAHRVPRGQARSNGTDRAAAQTSTPQPYLAAQLTGRPAAAARLRACMRAAGSGQRAAAGGQAAAGLPPTDRTFSRNALTPIPVTLRIVQQPTSGRACRQSRPPSSLAPSRAQLSGRSGH